jgi:hypothetical protein
MPSSASRQSIRPGAFSSDAAFQDFSRGFAAGNVTGNKKSIPRNTFACCQSRPGAKKGSSMTPGDFSGLRKNAGPIYPLAPLWTGSSEICPYRRLRLARDHPKFIEQQTEPKVFVNAHQ